MLNDILVNIALSLVIITFSVVLIWLVYNILTKYKNKYYDKIEDCYEEDEDYHDNYRPYTDMYRKKVIYITDCFSLSMLRNMDCSVKEVNLDYIKKNTATLFIKDNRLQNFLYVLSKFGSALHDPKNMDITKCDEVIIVEKGSTNKNNRYFSLMVI